MKKWRVWHYIHFSGYTIEEQFGWIPVLAICIFVGIFRFGVGPIPWFLGAELVPIDAQRWALPTIFFIGWGIAFIWSKSYLAAVAAFGYVIVFIFFMFVCVLGLLHTLIIPETKSKSRIEIQEALGAPVSKYVELKSTAVIIIEDWGRTSYYRNLIGESYRFREFPNGFYTAQPKYDHRKQRCFIE